MTIQFNPLPEPGDIVWCQFPQQPNLGNPGPKPRPALVVAVSEADHAIAVVYGTSQKTHQLYPGEFVLDPGDGGFHVSGLTVRTKFDLGTKIQLHFDSDWFSPSPSVHIASPLPKLGMLHPSYMQDLIKASRQIT